jgi:hypothetical protein
MSIRFGLKTECDVDPRGKSVAPIPGEAEVMTIFG